METYIGFIATILLVFIPNGEALRCWSCSSDLDPSCGDYFNTTKMLQQRSYYQQSNFNNQYQGGQRDPTPGLVECSNNLGQIYNQKQMCIKRVMNVPYGRKIVSRECKSVSVNQQAGTCPDKTNNIEFCEYCEYDGCNTATDLKVNLLLAMIVPCTLLYFLRR